MTPDVPGSMKRPVTLQIDYPQNSKLVVAEDTIPEAEVAQGLPDSSASELVQRTLMCVSHFVTSGGWEPCELEVFFFRGPLPSILPSRCQECFQVRFCVFFVLIYTLTVMRQLRADLRNPNDCLN